MFWVSNFKVYLCYMYKSVSNKSYMYISLYILLNACFVSPDVPGLVGIPFTADNLTADSCKLNWGFPENDGGSAITNYVIEKREAERKAWTSVSYSLARHSAVANNLICGKAYFFRVAAENAIGVGPFAETTSEIIVKEPISKSVIM